MYEKLKYQFTILVILSLFSCRPNTSNQAIQKTNIKTTIQVKKPTIQSYYPSSEFDHIEHIRNNSRIGEIDGKEHDPKYFVDYVIENLIQKSEYKKYITDRKLLRRLKNNICWDRYVLIKDSLSNGEEIRIEIETKSFNSEDHQLKYGSKSNFLIEVDEKYPFGSVYSNEPDKELESLSIQIGSRELKTSIEEYQNIFEPKFCNFGSHQRITEAYEDGENIYVYIFGGEAADSYFAKLIFNTDVGYITSIIANYGPLSDYGSFGSHFIGY